MCRACLRHLLSSTSLAYMQRVQVWKPMDVSEVWGWKPRLKPYSSKSCKYITLVVFVISMTGCATTMKEVTTVTVGKSSIYQSKNLNMAKVYEGPRRWSVGRGGR